jgi:protein cornichon
MGFSFAAASYIVALICDAFLIFFAIFHTIAFDELKTDYKSDFPKKVFRLPLISR